MNFLDANLNYLPYYVWNAGSSFNIDDQKSSFVKKVTFDPITFFCENWDDHPIRGEDKNI